MTTDERKGWVAVDYESRKKGRKEGIKAGASAERERILKIINRYLSEDYLLEGQFEKMLKEIEGVNGL